MNIPMYEYYDTVSVLLISRYKNYPYPLFADIYFLPIVSFIRKYPHIQILLTYLYPRHANLL